METIDTLLYGFIYFKFVLFFFDFAVGTVLGMSIMKLYHYITSIVLLAATVYGELPECAEDLITYSYTECDSENGRWRVAVPRTNECKLSNPPAPIRGKDCTFSCGKGEYLDLDTQSCKRCPPGTYSLGSGKRFNSWDKLEDGFMLSSSSVSFAEYGYYSKVNNCSSSTWKLHKDYISSNDDDCTSSLSYSVDVKSKGSVMFTYQYADRDVIFHFYVQNGECQTLHGGGRNVFLNTTGTDWRTYTTKLDVGTNVLYWKTTGILLNNRKKVSPVLIKDIEITGISYTTQCHKCLEGYYSDKEASSWCSACPENTFSSLGAKECTECDITQYYAPPTSPSCLKKPPCTEKDYFETHTPCDDKKKTKVMYKWMSPKICSEKDPASVSLPESGVDKDCLPCNPGFYPKKDSGKCLPCSESMYSDGKQECKQCPASTAPDYGFRYVSWDELPASMNVSCLSAKLGGCVNKQGWHPSGSMIESSPGQLSTVYLVLMMHVKGFRAVKKRSDGSQEFGVLTFAFELSCTRDCVLYLMQEVHGVGTSVIHKWHGKQAKQTFSHDISTNSTMVFSWAFQKTSSTIETDQIVVASDKAQIYLVNITNVIDSPADKCTPCVGGLNKDGCVSCPIGHFFDKPTKKCELCPIGTYISSESSDEKCRDCPVGTTNNSDSTACQSDCEFSIEKRKYDFTALSNPQAAFTPPSFTSSGRKYIHSFNFSLCGNDGYGNADCIDNASLASSNFPNMESTNRLTGMVCRSTKLSSPGHDSQQVFVFSQPQIISSHIKKIYQLDKNATTEESLFFPSNDKQELDDIVYVFFSTEHNGECPDGMTTTVHLRCDPTKEGNVIEMPAKYPDGTGDGCNFHFLWRSVEACPLCIEEDYNAIRGSCEDGIITTRYIWKMYPKNCKGGVHLPDYTKEGCLDLKLYVEIGVLGGVILLFIMFVTLCCVWKKSKKLEYKYQKLVSSASKNGGELPAAETCAISESESEEGEPTDDVIFQKKRARILGQNKTNNYESVSLKPMSHNV